MDVIQDQAEKCNGITGGVFVEYIHTYVQRYFAVGFGSRRYVLSNVRPCITYIYTRTFSLENDSDKEKQILGPY